MFGSRKRVQVDKPAPTAGEIKAIEEKQSALEDQLKAWRSDREDAEYKDWARKLATPTLSVSISSQVFIKLMSKKGSDETNAVIALYRKANMDDLESLYKLNDAVTQWLAKKMLGPEYQKQFEKNNPQNPFTKKTVLPIMLLLRDKLKEKIKNFELLESKKEKSAKSGKQRQASNDSFVYWKRPVTSSDSLSPLSLPSELKLKFDRLDKSEKLILGDKIQQFHHKPESLKLIALSIYIFDALRAYDHSDQAKEIKELTKKSLAELKSEDDCEAVYKELSDAVATKMVNFAKLKLSFVPFITMGLKKTEEQAKAAFPSQSSSFHL